MEKFIYICIALMVVLGLAGDAPFMIVLAMIFGGIFAASKGLLGAVKSSEASKPLQERMGTVLQRTQTLYKQQHYQVQFEDNGETINVMAHDGEGPMHLQPGDYGLMSVRGHTIYAFDPKKRGVSDDAIAVNANTLFADQITDWIDYDDSDNSN